MAYETVKYEKKEHIAYVTLNRPGAMNSVNGVMAKEMEQVWQDVSKDANVWVVVLSGEGRAFCAGADMKELAEYRAKGEDAPLFQRYTRYSDHRWMPLAFGLSKPLITAVNGICLGAGFHFIEGSDIIIASEEATFFDTHVNVGQVAAIEPIALSRRIPLGIVLQMFLQGSDFKLTAKRAYEVGLVNQVVPASELLPAATRIAQSIAKNSPLAVRLSKEAIWKGLNLGLEEALNLGQHILMDAWGSWDQEEGPRAFSEKRAPQWKGK